MTSSSALCLRAEELDGAAVPQTAGAIVETLQEAYRQKFEKETDPALRK